VKNSGKKSATNLWPIWKPPSNQSMNQQPTPMQNSFERVLREMRHGRSLTELSEELTNLVAAVRQTGKGGELVYTIKVKPASQGDVVTVQLEDLVKMKVPKPARGASIFYASEENALQRSDPRQRELELQEVPKNDPIPVQWEHQPNAIVEIS
jgi:hypothetical protein